MFNNQNKRSILIFPKFKNINKIQSIRNKYDRLANFISPHITLGQRNTLSNILFDYTFETLIDEVCIEQIGTNEECNIIKSIKI